MGTTHLEVLNGRRECAEHLRQLLRRNAELRDARRHKPALERYLRELRCWRRARQAELLPEEPRQRRAARFLLEALMAPLDFEPRDEQLERAFPLLERVMSAPALRAIAEVIEFHTLSQAFDHRTGEILFETMGQAGLSDESIADAVRLIDDYRGRTRQIELLRRIAQRLTRLAANRPLRPGLLGLAVMLWPLGLSRPLRSVADGLAAFSALPADSPQLAAFLRVQSEVLDRVYSGGTPFDGSADMPAVDLD